MKELPFIIEFPLMAIFIVSVLGSITIGLIYVIKKLLDMGWI